MNGDELIGLKYSLFLTKLIFFNRNDSTSGVLPCSSTDCPDRNEENKKTISIKIDGYFIQLIEFKTKVAHFLSNRVLLKRILNESK